MFDEWGHEGDEEVIEDLDVGSEADKVAGGELPRNPQPAPTKQPTATEYLTACPWPDPSPTAP
jgi:hypothetical protein